jgi:hypothetical protein
MRSEWVEGKNRFTISRKPYTDESKDADADEWVPITKWAIVTRRIDESGRVLTVLSGHSRSVQGVAEILTSETNLKQIVSRFKGSVPPEFQVLCCINMEKQFGQLRIKNRRVIKDIPLGKKRQAHQRMGQKAITSGSEY